MSETLLHRGGGPALRHLTSFSEILKQGPHGALLWKESNSILACLGGHPMPSFLSALQGLFPLSLPKPQSPASSNTTSPAWGPIPCVTLPPPGVQSHSETPRHQKGSTGEPGGWAHTSLSAPKHLLDGTHVRTCAGPGRGHSGAQVSHTERKRLWGDRARLRAGQAREPGAGAVRCRRRKGGARAGWVSPQQAGLSTQPPAWKAVPLNSTTGPRLKLPT